MSRATLLAIAIRAKSRAAMEEVETIEITKAAGCQADFRGAPGNRQVTVTSREAWEAACQQLGQSLPWTARRANLLVEGIDLAETTSHKISIGDVVLQVTGETDPCGRMNEAAHGLLAALKPNWRGGVCCRVIQGGELNVGDAVAIHKQADSRAKR